MNVEQKPKDQSEEPSLSKLWREARAQCECELHRPRELWRDGENYVFVTPVGEIGMVYAGLRIVATIREWHNALMLAL